MLIRLADYTANGTQEVNVKFTENVLRGIAQKTWHVLMDSNHLAILRDIFEKKYNSYRTKLNKTEEAYQFPNAPAFKLADQFLTPEVCDSIIDTFLVIGNKKNRRIPYNIFKAEYPAVFNHACRVWLTPKFQILSSKDIRRNLEQMHDTSQEDADLRQQLDRSPYTGQQLHEDIAKYAQQIEIFQNIDTYVWNYVKSQLKRAINTNSSNAKAVVFMPHAQAYGYLPDNSDKEREETGRFPDIYDADIWNRGKADYEQRQATKEQICAMIPRIWAFYDKYFTFDPKANYTEDEVKSLFGFLTDTAQYPHMFEDICKKLLGQDTDHLDLAIDDSTWDDIIDAVCSCSFVNGEKIIAELERNSDLAMLLSHTSRSALKYALKSIFEPKILYYKNKAKEFRSAYYAAQKEKAKNEAEQKRIYEEQSTADIIENDESMTDTALYNNLQEAVKETQQSRLYRNKMRDRLSNDGDEANRTDEYVSAW